MKTIITGTKPYSSFFYFNHKDFLDSSRIFVTFPRFIPGVPVTLGYVKSSTQLIEPYPSYDWHSSHGTDCNGMTSVFRVAFDGCNQMWVLDSGKIGDNQLCQPQLLIFNLNTDQLVKRYRFDTSVYTDTSLFITPVSGNFDYIFLITWNN